MKKKKINIQKNVYNQVVINYEVHVTYMSRKLNKNLTFYIHLKYYQTY